MPKNTGLISIASYYHSIYANLAKASLEAAGIYVYLMDENLTNCAPATGVALGGIKLFVPISQEKEARKLLGKDGMHSGVWMRNALPGRNRLARSLIYLWLFSFFGTIAVWAGGLIRDVIRG